MNADYARKISDDAQADFLKQNIKDIVEKIDKRIELSAGGSKQYKSSSVQIILTGDFDILNGVMLEEVNKHYTKNGFDVSFYEQSRTPDYIVIGW